MYILCVAREPARNCEKKRVPKAAKSRNTRVHGRTSRKVVCIVIFSYWRLEISIESDVDVYVRRPPSYVNRLTWRVAYFQTLSGRGTRPSTRATWTARVCVPVYVPKKPPEVCAVDGRPAFSFVNDRVPVKAPDNVGSKTTDEL